MLRFAAALMLSAMIASGAHASGRSDLKAGYDAVRRHDYAKAIQLLTGAIDSGDLSRANLALAYHYRGAEYLRINRYDEAIADQDRAIQLDPGKLPTAYNDRAIAYRNKGNYARAIADYSEAIRLWPDWHDWYLNRGIAYAADRQYDAAIADYSKALYYRPGLVTALIARADAYAQAGRKQQALADYEAALRGHASLFTDYPGVAEKIAALRAAP